ncbi:nth1 Endonuclease III [Candida maltosa Xu316]
MPPNIFKKVDPVDISKGPAKWADIYNSIVTMRSKVFTPVDSQGCERMPNTINPNIRTNNPKIYRFQLLISLMLSSQTKDEVNFEAMKNLHHGLLKTHPDGLCIESLSKLSESEIDAYINKVGFHNRKSTYIKKTCEILNEKFDGDVPKTIEEIVSLPGLGPKMGYLFLQNGWNVNAGIGVDVHLHRLAQMWGWVSAKANTPEKARLELEKWLPKQYWGDVNPLVVGFGQVVCVPRASNCDICTLARDGLCKSANKKLLKGPISEDRKVKLMKQRADLTQLINEVI